MRREHWLLLVAAVAPCLLSLSDQIQDYDPAQYAEVARRMLVSGDWLNPRDAFGPFTNKPPLSMWVQAATMAVVGVGSFAARFPSLVFGVIAVLATAWAGRELFNARVGGLAAVLVGASTAFHAMVADPKVDMPVLAFSTASVAAFAASRRSHGFVWVGWLSAGLAVLSKGPLGLMLPAAAVAPEVIRQSWRPDWPWWRRLFALAPLRGLTLVALLALPFYVAMARTNGDDTALYLLVGQSFGRLTGASGYRDTTTPLFFMHTGLWALLPFSLWLVLALIERARGLLANRTFAGSMERVALWWFAIPFVAISMSLFKLPQYLYWLTPPAALLTADHLTRWSEATSRRWANVGVALGLVVLAGVASVLWLSFPGSWWWLAAVAGAWAGLARFGWRLTGAERVVGTWAAASSAAFLFFHGHVHGALLAYQPWQAVAGVVRMAEPTAPAVLVTGVAAPHSLAYYAERDLQHVDAAAVNDLVRTAGSRVLVVGPDFAEEELTALGLRVDELLRVDGYPTNLVQPGFLLASERPRLLRPVRVLRARPSEARRLPPGT